MTVRMDSKLKVLFDELCAQFGMSANTAMNVFARAVVRCRRIPFEIAAPAQETMDAASALRQMRAMAEAGSFPDMTLDEINEEINKTRSEKGVTGE